MRSARDLVNTGGVVAEHVAEVHLHRHAAAGPATFGLPLQLGAVPAPADCFRHRAAVDGPLGAGGPVVLSGAAGTGKTQAAAHHAQLALQSGTVDLLLWVDAASPESIGSAYARAAERLGLDGGAESFLAWLNTTELRWLIVLDGLTEQVGPAVLRPARTGAGQVVATTRRRDPALRARRRQVVQVVPFTAEEAAGYLIDRFAVHELTLSPEEAAALAAGTDRLPGELSAAADRLVVADGARPRPGEPQPPRSVGCALCDPPSARTATTFTVLHAPREELWARWIEAVLTRAGLRVAAGHPADRRIVLLPSAHQHPPLGADAPAAGSVRVRIEGGPPAGGNSADPRVDLLGRTPASAAGALLAALGVQQDPDQDPDLTGLRYPGAAPAFANLPPRHPSFTGRDAVLEHLHRQLGDHVTAVLPSSQTLYGLGGIGKTQVALEYAHRYRSEYDLIWWIDAEQTESIALSLSALARRLGLDVGESAAQGAEAARQALGRGEPTDRWLLIFDNADQPADVRPYFPEGPGQILLTSRNSGWTRAAAALEVAVFSRQESIEHLERRVRGLTSADADAVATALGDLPLAVEVAAAWLDATAMPVDAYLAELRSALTTEGAFDYPRSVAATWSVSIARLRVEAPGAAKLLQLCALFAPEPISARLLYSTEMVRVLSEHDPACTGVFGVSAAVRALGRYSLARVTPSPGSVQLHRLVQSVIRHEMSEHDHRTAAHQVHRILTEARPAAADGIDDPANWAAFNDIWPHLGPCDARLCGDPGTRQLLIDRVRYLWTRGDLPRARLLARELDEEWTAKFGADDRQTLRLRFQRASVLRSAGEHAQALDLDRSTLQSQRLLLGDRHPDALATAGSLAADLRTLGRFRAALELDRETLTNHRELYDDDHPRVLVAANNLAIGLRLVGDDGAALELERETWRRRTAVLGARHPHTLSSLVNIGRGLRELGDFRESARVLREVLDVFDASASERPDGLRAAASLAVTLRRAGATAEARALTERVHASYLKGYGADAPEALSCALNLAADLCATGEHEKALALAEEAYGRHRRLLGEEHPFTLVCRADLAIHLRRCGRTEPGLAHAERAVTMLAQVVGDDHPYTLAAVVNLAGARLDTGRADLVASVEPALSAAHRELVRRLGPQHPSTLACAAALARALLLLGRTEPAAELHAFAVEGLARRLGEDHPDTLAARDRRTIDQHIETQPL